MGKLYNNFRKGWVPFQAAVDRIKKPEKIEWYNFPLGNLME
jgi:hypothetical protein